MIKYYVGMGVLTAVVIGVLVYAFNSTGSPRYQRNLRQDQTRSSDLSSLKYSVESYFSTNDKLPAKLSDVKNSYTKIEDPETGEEYGYVAVDEYKYKLCATFATESPDSGEEEEDTSPKGVFSLPSDSAMSHTKGYNCFEYEVPELYRTSLDDWGESGSFSSYDPFSFVTTQFAKISSSADVITSPNATTTFKQGSANSINSTKDMLFASIYLLDSTGKVLGTIAKKETCNVQASPSCQVKAVTWDGVSISGYADNTMTDVPVVAGKYKIGIIEGFGTAAGLSQEFTIAAK